MTLATIALGMVVKPFPKLGLFADVSVAEF
jgi:hypothetical protein